MRMSDEQWGDVLEHQPHRRLPHHPAGDAEDDAGRFGRIVNVSSVSGQAGQAGQANYSAAKAGLRGPHPGRRPGARRRGITCNVVAPGPIVTAMTEGLPDDWRAWAEQTVPLGRLGTPEEVGGRGRLPVLRRRRRTSPARWCPSTADSAWGTEPRDPGAPGRTAQPHRSNHDRRNHGT